MQNLDPTPPQFPMPYPRVLHDCSTHHRPVDPKAATPLMLRSHGFHDLQESIFNTVYRDREAHALHEYICYNFLRDYRSADTDKMTLEQLHEFLRKLAGHIDKFYFHGCLIGDKEYKLVPNTLSQPLLKIRVFDKSIMLSKGCAGYGVCLQPIPRSMTSYIDLFIRDARTGKRRPKIGILNTLVHELCHLYFVFFNYCPVADEAFLIEGPDDDSHGPLWKFVYDGIIFDMRRWDIRLATLGESPPSRYPPEFYISYMRWAQWLCRTQRHWNVADVRSRRPQILFGEWRGLPWRQERKEEFRRALLRLTYVSPEQYTMSHVPSPEGALRAVKWICSLASVAALLCYLYFDALGAIAATFVQDYRDGLLHEYFYVVWGLFLTCLRIVWEVLKEGFWSFRDSLENKY